MAVDLHGTGRHPLLPLLVSGPPLPRRRCDCGVARAPPRPDRPRHRHPAHLVRGRMIPRLIHFVWTGKKPLPEWGRRHMAEFARLNPGYEVRLHGDEALAPDYAYLAGQCTDPAQVADLIRYSVLEREGGWYFDLDFLPFRPLAEAEAAWGITGDKLALARIRGHRSGEIAP